MAIRFKRQTSSYNPKDHRIKENVKDFVYTLDSAATKASNSTKALTNTIVSGVQQFSANPVGTIKRDIANAVTFKPVNIETDYQNKRSQFEAGQITPQEFQA